mgnify:CR=1 FL=1
MLTQTDIRYFALVDVLAFALICFGLESICCLEA